LNLRHDPAEISLSPVHQAFGVQRLAHAQALPAVLALRRDRLARLLDMVLKNCDALAVAIDHDFAGRSRHETQLLELFPALEGVRHARRHVRQWMRPQRRGTSLWFLPGRSEVRPQALGVVGIVVPWNYPVFLAVAPLAAALAAGNRAMVKMSEFTPATGELFAALVARAFDPAEVTVVNGSAEVAQEFVALPFDHLLFTGSTAVGRQVMRAAAANLTPVTLELGGKSPAIIGPGARLDVAAERILLGKCVNAGQTCIAPDYVLIPAGRIEEFTTLAKGVVSRFYPRLRNNPDYSSIVNDRHRARLAGLAEDAVARGATLVPLHADDLSGTPKNVPQLVLGGTDAMAVMHEEIFGPLLPVVPYGTLDEAIAYVNARPRPLALYIFDEDRANVDAVLERTVSGGVSVNETLLHVAQENLPFGGVGASGMGAYHGRDGFDTFSKLKPVFRQSRLNGLGLFMPPYRQRFEWLIRLLMRK
jgi:acyl-CoA reductase-like NAD-dependent aldehyde dehydrogenase